MNQTKDAIEFNLLGKWISQNNNLYLVNDSIYLNDSPIVELVELTDFLDTTANLFGIKLKISSHSKCHAFRFLKNNESNRYLIHKINETLQNRIAAKVEEVNRQIYKNAIQEFLKDSAIETLSKNIEHLYRAYSKSKNNWHKYLNKSSLDTLENILKTRPIDKSIVSHFRQAYEERILSERKSFFDSIESNPLTNEQRLAVIRENDRNLVLAAAGTGKTSVMVAKALDLIDQEKASPDEILILAYNKAAALELDERLHHRAELAGLFLSTYPQIMTFHATGKKILQDSGISTSISYFAEDDTRLELWVSEWLMNYLKSSTKKMQNFIRLTNQPMSPFDFDSKEEYEKYIRDNEFRTLKGELVRGYQELVIANWLYLNGVKYEYEPIYLAKRRIEIGFDYRPDFHIVDTNLYIEHFGIDRQGNTRADINKVEYNEAIEKKRLLHREFETTLLETYHYDWVENNLENRLKLLLKEHGIEVKPINPNKTLNYLKESGFIQDKAKTYLKSLQAIRVERLDRTSISQRLEKAKIHEYKLYAEFLSDLLDAYKRELHKQDSIDFDDMILKASQCINSNLFVPKWKYILVDEFQDISEARMELLDSIINHSKSSPLLTVVGDDWQSIYRFSGGKLELTTRFEKLIGSCSTTMLQKTFRYNNSIADVAGRFVMKNPEQYRKNVTTHTQVDTPQVYLLDDKVNNTDNLDVKTLQVIKKIKEQDPEASIAVLARYNYILRNIRNTVRLRDIKYWTFHGSKGLEADYCILVGFFQGKIGFPNENKDDAVVEALLPALDSYPHSEERRLLYVAITRAKNKCYIIADPNSPSEFINEIVQDNYPIQVSSPKFGKKYQKTYKCPVCTNGYFKLVNGQHGKFYRCSSGRSCTSNPRVCPQCGAPCVDNRTTSKCQNEDCSYSFKICPKCGRSMKLKDGPYGKFWGCTGYAFKDDQCTYTENYLN